MANEDTNMRRAELNVHTALEMYAKARNAGLGDKEIFFALDRVMGSLRTNPSLMTNAAKGDLGSIAVKMQEAIDYAQHNPNAVNLHATGLDGTSLAAGAALQLLSYDQARRRSLAGLRDGNDEVGGEGASSGSSRRFAGMRGAGSSSEGSLATYAQGVGLSWISANPEITRQLLMGGVSRSDIKLLADMHLTENSYRRLIDAGFKAKDAVSIAKYAKAKGLDANKLHTTFADLEKTVPQTPEEKRRLREALIAHIDHPEDKKAKRELDETFKHFRKKYPGKAHHIDRAEKALRLRDANEAATHDDHRAMKKANDDALAGLKNGFSAKKAETRVETTSTSTGQPNKKAVASGPKQ